jgi:hypothetical protein
MITTRTPQELPEPKRLRELCKVLAVLESIFEPDQDTRPFHFEPKWGRGTECASRDGNDGNTCFVWFSPRGTVVIGFDHEVGERDPDDVFFGLPPKLEEARTEPAFGDSVSFALWRTPKDDRWRTGKLAKGNDGSKGLLAMYEDHPLEFIEFARDVYEMEPKGKMQWVERLYDGKTLTPEVIAGVRDLDAKAIASVLKLAKKLGLPASTKSPIATAKRKGKPPRAPRISGSSAKLGPGQHDAMFLVTLDGDRVAFGWGSGKPVLSVRDPDLYDALVDVVRRTMQSRRGR